MSMPRRRTGFALIELVIVVGIVAIISAYAIPTYQQHIRRSHRFAAVSALYRAAQYVEREIGSGAASHNDRIVLPAGLDHAPSEGAPAYRLRVAASTQTNGGYTIVAEPVPQGPMGNDPDCGSFTLDATGRRHNVKPSAVHAEPSDLGYVAAEPLRAGGVRRSADSETVTRCWGAR
jgi:type IV pilus assembly protein PilE